MSKKITKFIISLSVVLISFSPIYSQTDYSDVLVVINNNSSISDSVGSYFVSVRNIPLLNIVRVNVSTSEEINGITFDSLRGQIETHLINNALVSKINYIVTTKGVPLRVNRGNTFSTSSPSSSVESELSLILTTNSNKIGQNGFFLSPYFLSNQNFSKVSFDMYLVTRLDGYTFANIKNLIDRASASVYIDTTYKFVFDQDPLWNSSIPFLNNSLSAAHSKLLEKGLKSTLENTTLFLTRQNNVIGYTSWGGNDHNHHHYTQYARPQNNWAPGAIAETYVSTSGRTFVNPVFYGQSVIADLVAEGVTGAKGYVYEPFSNAMAIVWILFDKYTSGFNLAESIYMSSRALSWMDVIIGDPKMKVHIGGQCSLPIQLASFTGNFITSNKIKLEWTTISEVNNYGFFVERLDLITQSFITIESSFQAGAGYTLQPQYYSWTDDEMIGDTVQYRLRQIDNDGLENYHGPITVVKNPLNVRESRLADISEYKVLKNYPNPFNPTTDIIFNLISNSKVTLRIFNSIGQEVAELINKDLPEGFHSINFDGSGSSSGVDFST